VTAHQGEGIRVAQASIRVGHDPDFPPFGWRAGDESRGWLIELVGAALTRARIRPRFVPTPLPRLDAALERGELDAIAFHGVVPERKIKFAHSAPLVVSGGAWFVPETTAWPEGSPPDGAAVATPERGPLVGVIGRLYPSVTVVKVADYPAALNAALDGKADAAALNLHVGSYLIRRDYAGRFHLPNRPFLPIDMAFCCLAGEQDELLSAIDGALAALRREGVTADLERKYMGA
jgi:ABC-type amino acid transport substrate-binding protein